VDVPVRCFRLFRRIDGRDQMLMLAGQGFIALVPLLIVLASAFGSGGSDRLGRRIIVEMSLSGTAADSVRILFTYPPGATGGITGFSMLLLLYSLNGFFGSLQRVFEKAWALPSRGYRGAAHRAAGAMALLGGLVTVGWIGASVGDAPLARVLGLALQVALLVGVWVLGMDLILCRRVERRRLVPGAVLTAALQLTAGWASAIYMPEIFLRQTTRYGVIGAALALVTWLITVAAVLVVGAVVSAVLGAPQARAAGQPTHAPGPAPGRAPDGGPPS
jgi:membrane protein